MSRLQRWDDSLLDPFHDESDDGSWASLMFEIAADLADDIRTNRNPALREEFVSWCFDQPEQELVEALLGDGGRLAGRFLDERAHAEHAKECRDAA